MKHLPKHLQPRWRYLAVRFETWPDATVDRGAFQRELWYAAQNLLGDVGSAAVDLTVVRFDGWDGGGEAIVRVRRGECERARAIVACVDAIGSDPVGLRVAGTSGTVRACEEKYMRGGPERTEQRHVTVGDAERPAVVRDGRLEYRMNDAFTAGTPLDIE
ncbi:Rpp14/Pop5 family protein [Halapricum hydrolyticum]|uniref:Ribonuclease P protein component 2 n=1 Tax=Halapricum hydrolyticum TaxID=2979991 RepID=A0AAE3I964_9EURY|nr:Rpp14/Pop5 family protein [Halapricum hydrolyticum]MCU4716763.1 ribonuclease P [Halapricum hydrolyticum]MCU4725632.1 ribonuclease P [Halapricum hydrolyticum]